MARRPRLQFAGGFYHVMARGNRKSTIFHDDHDRRQLLHSSMSRRLLQPADHGVCLMRNHYHFLLETPEPNLSLAMQFINGVFARVRTADTSKPAMFSKRGSARLSFNASPISCVPHATSCATPCGLVSLMMQAPGRGAAISRPPAWSPSLAGSTSLGFGGPSRRVRCPRLRGDTLIHQRTDGVPTARALNAIVLGTKRSQGVCFKFAKRFRPDHPAPRVIRRCSVPLCRNCSTESRRVELHGPSHLHCTREHGYRFTEIARYLASIAAPPAKPHADIDRRVHVSHGLTPEMLRGSLPRATRALFTIHGLTPNRSHASTSRGLYES